HEDILHGGGVPSPDLTGYASEEWLTGIIAHAGDSKYFGERNDGMPEFRKQLRPEEIQLLVDWMRGQWPRPVQETQEGP
ncbi:MAG: cytochrome c, partial [Planctomycetes bacterium]|nr:cytochrome c [Planctomycetota bacterium]